MTMKTVFLSKSYLQEFERMLSWFFSGHAHDYYALILIFLLALLLYSFKNLRGHPIVYVVIMILSAGVFVDLWAHRWKH